MVDFGLRNLRLSLLQRQREVVKWGNKKTQSIFVRVNRFQHLGCPKKRSEYGEFRRAN